MKALVLAIVLGVSFLFVFYRAVEVRWPESYFGATDTSVYAISATPLRYVLFRFAPVYATCLFVAVSLDRRHEHALAGTVGTAAIYSAVTVGRALVQGFGVGRVARRHRAPVLLLRAVVTAGLVLVGYIAFFSRGALAPLVPGLGELSATLWTAVFAGIVGAFVVRVSRTAGNETAELINASRSSIPSEIWQLAAEVANQAGADVNLVRSVMIVENLQRPGWFRVLERLKSHVLPHGTYGIMQVASDRSLSDRESVELAVDERFRNVPLPVADGYPDVDALKEFARRYNPDPGFAELLVAAYLSLHWQQ